MSDKEAPKPGKNWKDLLERGADVLLAVSGAQPPRTQADLIVHVGGIVSELIKGVLKERGAAAAAPGPVGKATGRYTSLELKMVALDLLGLGRDEQARMVNWAGDEVDALRAEIAARGKLLEEVLNCDAGLPGDLSRRIEELVLNPKPKAEEAAAKPAGVAS